MNKLLNYLRNASTALLILAPLMLLCLVSPNRFWLQLTSSTGGIILHLVLLFFFASFLKVMDRKAKLHLKTTLAYWGSILQITAILISLTQFIHSIHLLANYSFIPALIGMIFYIVFFWSLGSSVPKGKMRTCTRVTALSPILIYVISFGMAVISTITVSIEDFMDLNTVTFWQRISAATNCILSIAVYAWFFRTFYHQLKK